MPPLASWNGQLPTDVMLDSGVIYIDSSGVWSAQDGGIKFDPGREMRQIPFDGQRAQIVGLDRNTGFKPVLSGNIIEIPSATLLQLEPGSATGSITGSPSGLTSQVVPKQAGVLYAAGDYLTNVKCIWMRGDGTYVQIRFPKCIVNKWDLTSSDKTEAKAAVELEARLDMTVSGAHVYDPVYVVEYFTVAPT